MKVEFLHHLRDTGFAMRISHRYRGLWIKARRLVAQVRSDGEIAQALSVPVDVWRDVRVACGVPPLRLGGRELGASDGDRETGQARGSLRAYADLRGPARSHHH